MQRAPRGKLDSDEKLLRRAMTGDAPAFGKLYQTYLDSVYRYIYLQVGSEIEAEKMTEEVFGRAWTLLPNFDGKTTSFEAWLFQIARNMLVSRERIVERHSLSSGPGPGPGRSVPQHTGGDLLSAVQMLSDVEKQVILLRFVEGLSYSEISRIIRQGEAMCQAIQERAVDALRQQFAGMRVNV